MQKEKTEILISQYAALIISGEACIQEIEKCPEIGWFHPSQVPASPTAITPSIGNTTSR